MFVISGHHQCHSCFGATRVLSYYRVPHIWWSSKRILLGRCVYLYCCHCTATFLQQYLFVISYIPLLYFKRSTFIIIFTYNCYLLYSLFLTLILPLCAPVMYFVYNTTPVCQTMWWRSCSPDTVAIVSKRNYRWTQWLTSDVHTDGVSVIHALTTHILSSHRHTPCHPYWYGSYRLEKELQVISVYHNNTPYRHTLAPYHHNTTLSSLLIR